MLAETFWELLGDPAHWFFEIFLMILFDFVIGYMIWQRLVKPHIHKDMKHAGHDHGPHEEHVVRDPVGRTEELETGVGIAMYHLDQDDPESAWRVLVDLKARGTEGGR